MYFFFTVILFIKRTCVCCCTTHNWTNSHFNEWINSCLTQLAKQMESTFTAREERHRANRYAENARWIYDSNFHYIYYIYAVFTYHEYRRAGFLTHPHAPFSLSIYAEYRYFTVSYFILHGYYGWICSFTGNIPAFTTTPVPSGQRCLWCLFCFTLASRIWYFHFLLFVEKL